MTHATLRGRRSCKRLNNLSGQNNSNDLKTASLVIPKGRQTHRDRRDRVQTLPSGASGSENEDLLDKQFSAWLYSGHHRTRPHRTRIGIIAYVLRRQPHIARFPHRCFSGIRRWRASFERGTDGWVAASIGRQPAATDQIVDRIGPTKCRNAQATCG